ncbi:hypothetical protein DFH09DRAFT_1354944 [Mycena vulgaris]|nr:hypothetical protein DFH09DRAFT_1354944 [Mycena vulgaris]
MRIQLALIGTLFPVRSASSMNRTIGPLDSSVDFSGRFTLNCKSDPACVADTSDDIRISFTGFAIYIFLAPSAPCHLWIDGNFIDTVFPSDVGDENIIFRRTHLHDEPHTLMIRPGDEVEFDRVIVTLFHRATSDVFCNVQQVSHTFFLSDHTSILGYIILQPRTQFAFSKLECDTSRSYKF